jgi:D-amino-acid oxidase
LSQSPTWSRANSPCFRAGVIGLTAALVLADEGNYDVTVVAKHMPGDYDIMYCSPVAGANYLP